MARMAITPPLALLGSESFSSSFALGASSLVDAFLDVFFGAELGPAEGPTSMGNGCGTLFCFFPLGATGAFLDDAFFTLSFGVADEDDFVKEAADRIRTVPTCEGPFNLEVAVFGTSLKFVDNDCDSTLTFDRLVGLSISESSSVKSIEVGELARLVELALK